MKQPSHLNEAQAHNVRYDYKQKCEWCDAPYDTEVSDAKLNNRYCSRDCERLDEFMFRDRDG